MPSAQLLSGLGAAAAIFLSALGSAIASAHGGIFASKSPSAGLWSYAPIVIAGVLAIYGFIIALIIQYVMNGSDDVIVAYRCLSSGLVVGLGCLASGIGMSRFLEMYMTSHASGSKTSSGIENVNEASPLMGSVTSELPVTWTLCFSLVFLEAIGLYSLIVALFLAS